MGKSSKHMDNMKAKDQTPSIAGVFQPANASQVAANVSEQVAPPVTTVTATSRGVDLRLAFGSTPTMKAEVLWILHTLAKHHSYNGNDGISELFKSMFPDSDI